MVLQITGEVWYWRGPAPWFFVTIPKEEALQIKAMESMATYGWGMIPVNATIGVTEWYTALWPKDGLYILPLKTAIRKAEGIEEGDTPAVQIEVIINKPLQR